MPDHTPIFPRRNEKVMWSVTQDNLQIDIIYAMEINLQTRISIWGDDFLFLCNGGILGSSSWVLNVISNKELTLSGNPAWLS